MKRGWNGGKGKGVEGVKGLKRVLRKIKRETKKRGRPWGCKGKWEKKEAQNTEKGNQ